MTAMAESSGNRFEPQLVDIFVSILPKILDLKKEWDSRHQEFV
jgi:hypothetical protein